MSTLQTIIDKCVPSRIDDTADYFIFEGPRMFRFIRLTERWQYLSAYGWQDVSISFVYSFIKWEE